MPRYRPVGVADGGRPRRPARPPPGQLRLADPGQRLGDRGVRRQDHRLGGHHAARGVVGVAQQLPHRRGLLGLHQVEQRSRCSRRQLGEQVGRVVGVHLLQDVGGALAVELAEDLDLVVLGQLLQHVGEALVVERGGDLGAPLVRQILQAFARSAGRICSSGASRLAVPWPVLPDGEAGDRVPVDVERLAAPPQPQPPAVTAPPRRTATLVTSQSRVRFCSMPRSTTATCSPVVGELDPAVEQLVEHQSLGAALLEPAHVEPAVEDDRVGVDGGDPADRQEDPAAGAPRRPARGRAAAWCGRSATTTSRTRPTWSPAGSKTAIPASRATKTRDGVPVMPGRYRRVSSESVKAEFWGLTSVAGGW